VNSINNNKDIHTLPACSGFGVFTTSSFHVFPFICCCFFLLPLCVFIFYYSAPPLFFYFNLVRQMLALALALAWLCGSLTFCVVNSFELHVNNCENKAKTFAICLANNKQHSTAPTLTTTRAIKATNLSGVPRMQKRFET